MGSHQSSPLGKQSLAEELSVALDELLTRIRTNDTALAEVDVPNSRVGDGGVATGAMALCHNTTVRSLNLSFNGLTSLSMPPLVKGIAHNNLITHLNLAGNKIGDDGCLILGYFLSQNPSLEVLSLYHCGLKDPCAHSLVNGLVGNTNLAVLRLEMNELTNATVLMFAQLFAGGYNETLAVLSLQGNTGQFSAGEMTSIAEHLAGAAERYEERRSAAAYEQKRLAALAAEEAKERQQQSDEEALRQQQQQAALAEQQRRQAEEELLLRERELEEAMKQQQQLRTGAMARQEALARRQQQIEQAMASALQWREKLSGCGVKEWRDGFTVMSTRPGDAPGAVPSLVPEPPRRLKACWCDPHDVAAPFAKTLHYHCKHEAAKQALEEGDAPKYQGCRATGHVCASVGFFAKPLPDLSAAHFFASAHPASCT
jgi:hypothetical protein